MYDELIEQLKSRASWLEFAIIAKPNKTDGNGDAILFRKAADAIERLDAIAETYVETVHEIEDRRKWIPERMGGRQLDRPC